MEAGAPKVTELGYLELAVEDLAAWRFFAGDVLGLECVEVDEHTVELRMDYWHRRFTLRAAGTDAVTAVGWRTAGSGELDQLVAHLRANSIEVEECSAAEAEERHVMAVYRTVDPSGVVIELFHGPRVDAHQPFRPGRGMHGRFVTGDGGLGHLVLGQPSTVEAHRFYSLLGMRGEAEYPAMSDDVVDTPTFMHCNQRDHSIAFGMGQRPGVGHVMIETDSLDDVGLAYDLCLRNDVPVAYHPGKHSNDHMHSVYVVSPSGFEFEYGFGGRPSTHQSEYYPEDIYGHLPDIESAPLGPKHTRAW